MSAIWFMTTRNRPHQCMDLVAAFKAVGDVPPAAIMIDDDPAKYACVRWPAHWNVHVAPEHLEMSRAHNMLLEMYPGRDCYGWWGDHFRPLTPMFPALKTAAGDWFISWPTDQNAYLNMCGAPTFGAKLIRELGWICLPTTVHVATELPFNWLWDKLGIVKVLRDQQFTRTRPNGWGHRPPRSYRGRDFYDDDARAVRKWRNEEAPGLIMRIRAAMIADGYEFLDNGVIHPKHGCTIRGAGEWQQNLSIGNIERAHAT